MEKKLAFREKVSLIMSVILSKEFMLWGLLILLLVFLRLPLEQWVVSKMVPVFSIVKPEWQLDILTFLVTIIIGLITYHRYRRYTPSNGFTVFIAVSALIYMGYRIAKQPWEYTSMSFSWLSWLKYGDMVFAVAASQLLLWFPNKNRKVKVDLDVTSFYEDKPLDDENEDNSLGYKIYAHQVAKKLLASDFESAFAIGVNGKWGIGKTTFLKLMESKLREDDIISFDFSPWNRHSANGVIQDFFESFQEAISPYHSGISRLSAQYANKLQALNNNGISQSIQVITSTITGLESTETLYLNINKALKRINKKVIVFIDDLDRLDKREVLEVIRLIRNTANFYNTVFIVAYDRSYIIEALRNQLEYRHESFLEKIFQLEINLPYFDRVKLRQELFKKLEKALPSELRKQIENTLIGKQVFDKGINLDWIENMRDVTRFANTIILNLERLGKEVDISDFVRIELLRLKYPSAYELLYRNKNQFLERTVNSHEKPQYQLIYFTDDHRGIEVNSVLENYLKNNYRDLGIPLKDVDDICSYLEDLFGKSLLNKSFFYSHLSIVFEDRFNSYFSYKLETKRLSEEDFSKARRSSITKFHRKIESWNKEGMLSNVINRLTILNDFYDRRDYEKIIEIIFFLSRQVIISEDRPAYFATYEGRDLLGKLSLSESNVRKFYGEKGEAKFKEFVVSCFNKAEFPYYFEAGVLSSWQGQNLNDFILTDDEMNSYTIHFLRSFTQKAKKVDNNLWHLYHSSKHIERVSRNEGGAYTNHKSVPLEVAELMKEFFIKKDLDGFIFSIISIEPFENQFFKVSSVVLEIFNTWDNFKGEIFAIQDDDSNYLEEFKEFINSIINDQCNVYERFDFKVIPVLDKVRRQNLA